MIKKITCKGRHTVSKNIPCSFEHFGEWNDIELIEHQRIEKRQDTKMNWWTGFDVDPRFTALKEEADNIKKEKL